MMGFAKAPFSFVLAACLTSCVVVVSFEEYGTPPARELALPAPSTPAPAPTTLYGVAGTVSGLDGEPLTLLLNGVPLTVGDGPFRFPASLPNGATYTVSLDKDPPTHACSAEHTTGSIHGVDASGVEVRCLSRDATLSSLMLSEAVLSPRFDPSTLVYTARLKTRGVFAPATAIATATTTRLDARLSIAGTASASGEPGTPLSFPAGDHPVDIVVTAPDGRSSHTYTIRIRISPEDYIKASNPRAGAHFGNSVAISGDTMAVGSQDVSGGGEVCVFTRVGSTWSEQACLKPSTSRTGYFGLSVALSGDTLVVGAPYGDGAYVFARSGTTWSEQAILTPPAPVAFGWSVALAGDTIVVGDPSDKSKATGVDGDTSDTSLVGAGAAHVFTRSSKGWSRQAYLKAVNTRQYARFGQALALAGDTLIVGAPQESSAAKGIGGDPSDTSADSAGAVYVFARNDKAWSQASYVKASNAHSNAQFGASVAISGESFVVGSPLDTIGAAYVFLRSGATWSEQAYIKPDTGPSFLNLGASTAIDGDLVALGAQFDSPGGAVHLYRRTGTTWSAASVVRPTMAGLGLSRFGSGVFLSQGTLVVGASEESGSSPGVNPATIGAALASAGAVYVY